MAHGQIEQLVQELSGFNSSAIISVSVDVKEEDLLTAANQLSEESKKLPKLRVCVCVCVCVCVRACVCVCRFG